MDAIEIILTIAILVPLGIPAWIAIAFLIGWARAEEARGEAFYWLQKRKTELEEKMRKTET